MRYYRKLFAPLMRLVWEGVRITYPTLAGMRVSFDHVAVRVERLRIAAQPSTRQRTQESSVLAGIISAVMKLQMGFKKMRQREWFRLKTERKA